MATKTRQLSAFQVARMAVASLSKTIAASEDNDFKHFESVGKDNAKQLVRALSKKASK